MYVETRVSRRKLLALNIVCEAHLVGYALLADPEAAQVGTKAHREEDREG